MRKSVLAFAAGAVVFGGASATIHFVLVPDQERIQSSQDTVVHYAGTATFLDQQAVAAGNMTHAFAKDVPFTADERVKAVALHGDTAVLSDVTTTAGPAAPVLGNPSLVWAVDRTTLMPAPAPAGSHAMAHQGLAVGFGFSPGAHDYPWWDGATQAQTTAKYVRSEKHAGRSTKVFTVDATGPAKDQTLVRSLPPGVPATMLTALASTMPTAQQQALAAMLPKGGGIVPLSYAAQTKTTMWVDQLTGTTVDAQSTETVTAQMHASIGEVPLAPVLTINTNMSPAGVTDAVKQSKDDESKLLWLGTIAPLALAAAAAALLGAAAWSLRASKSR